MGALVSALVGALVSAYKWACINGPPAPKHTAWSEPAHGMALATYHRVWPSIWAFHITPETGVPAGIQRVCMIEYIAIVTCAGEGVGGQAAREGRGSREVTRGVAGKGGARVKHGWAGRGWMEVWNNVSSLWILLKQVI